MRRNCAEDRPPPLGGDGPGSSAPGYGERRRGERRMFTHFTRRRETAMRRMAVALGILGLGMALTAAAARADTNPNAVKTGSTVTLFGQKYTVEIHKRDGTFTNGLTIHLQ